jgi:hypothetical protein
MDVTDKKNDDEINRDCHLTIVSLICQFALYEAHFKTKCAWVNCLRIVSLWRLATLSEGVINLIEDVCSCKKYINMHDRFFIYTSNYFL